MKVKKEQLQLFERIIARAKQDSIWFIENFIIPPDLDTPLKLYPKQKELIRSILEDHFVIVNSSRQVGKTTAVSALIVWMVIFFPRYRVAIISRDGDHVKDIMLEIHAMIEKVIEKLPVVKFESTREFEKRLTNGSRIKGSRISLSNPEKIGRGTRAGFVYIDEAAFIPNIDKIYTALIPTTTRIHQIYKEKKYPYGICITSTPNGTEGIGKWFYEMWLNANAGTNIFKPITIHWSEVPYYDEEWAREERTKVTPLEWEQEYELKFLAGANSFLDEDLSLEIQNIPDYEPKHILNIEKTNVYLFDDISPEKMYIFGVDSASGTGGTSEQAFVIIEYPSERVIGYCTTKQPILTFAKVLETTIKTLFEKQDNYVLVIERNYLGEALIDYAQKNSLDIYSRIFSTKNTKKKASPFKLQGHQYIKGIATTKHTRPLMFDALYDFLQRHKGNLDNVLLPKPLRQQILALEYSGRSKIQTPPSIPDDLVMSLAIILYARTHLNKDFKRFVARVEMETTKEQEVIDVLSLWRARY